MRRRRNPVSIIITILIIIGVIVAAFLVKNYLLPESMEKYANLIFWGIIAGGGGLVCFLCGRFLNKK